MMPTGWPKHYPNTRQNINVKQHQENKGLATVRGLWAHYRGTYERKLLVTMEFISKETPQVQPHIRTTMITPPALADLPKVLLLISE
jgi:hypothetical protein